VAARSKTTVWDGSHAGIVGSKPADGMDVCLSWLLCFVRWSSARRADHLSRGVLPSVLCVSLDNEGAVAN
jgi:hypothetical protein